jgi:hypothetical protein
MKLEGVSQHWISPLELGYFLLAQKLLGNSDIDLTAGNREFGWLSNAVSFHNCWPQCRLSTIAEALNEVNITHRKGPELHVVAVAAAALKIYCH